MKVANPLNILMNVSQGKEISPHGTNKLVSRVGMKIMFSLFSEKELQHHVKWYWIIVE
jgi:hypothetical protein